MAALRVPGIGLTCHVHSNRVWAAVKREALYALAQGTCTPESLDALWELRLGAFKGPFKM